MNDNFLNSANAPYVAELFYKYSQDPNSVDSSWGNFFNSLNENDLSVLGDFGGPEWKKRPSNIIDGISFDKATRLVPNIKVDSFRTTTLDSIRTLPSRSRFNGGWVWVVFRALGSSNLKVNLASELNLL